MKAPISLPKIQGLYQTDYLQWIEATVQKIQSRAYGAVDWENLIEEIEDMGRRERQSLESNFITIVIHLLKWQFRPQKRSGSWEGSIIEHRRRVNKALKDSPSLNPYLESVEAECYEQAVKQAKAETGLPLESFPLDCPYKLADMLKEDFLPSEQTSL
ncbi:MAG: DUF29 domain-containing protein [Timaviella obliquedivisa GSE-PSE-MK23-08B]|jgi:hypothetical protein|nr:DUF29 domain-containing protein [Timaviella obliquedivisa GSE-PSE-MK23-08B]